MVTIASTELVGALARGAARSLDAAAVASTLRGWWAEAREAWPELEVDPVAFMGFVGGHIAADTDVVAALHALRPGDLLLCFCCLQRDPTALTVFDANYLSVAPAVVRRLQLDSDEADEVRQLLRQRLLVGNGDGAPRLAQYAGRGDLRNWVRTAALRLAHNRMAADRQHAKVDSDRLERAIASGPEPDLAVVQAQYGQLFGKCFEAAVADLTPKERTLLRLAYVEGMSSDALGAMHAVHRATAARWVASARDRLSARTRRRMMNQLGVARSDLQSILRLIQSQVNVSVRRCLGDDADDC